jgi:L-asparagine transporter-like permease
MIGKVLWQEFFSNRDWPIASAVAIIMLTLLVVPILFFHHYQARELEKKAANLLKKQTHFPKDFRKFVSSTSCFRT